MHSPLTTSRTVEPMMSLDMCKVMTGACSQGGDGNGATSMMVKEREGRHWPCQCIKRWRVSWLQWPRLCLYLGERWTLNGDVGDDLKEHGEVSGRKLQLLKIHEVCWNSDAMWYVQFSTEKFVVLLSYHLLTTSFLRLPATLMKCPTCKLS